MNTQTSLSELEKKKIATNNFFKFGSLLPIIIPVSLLILYRFACDKTLLNEDVPYYFIPLIILGFMPWKAKNLYSSSHTFWKGKSNEYIPVDIFLYIVGITTVIIVGLLVNLTGGFSNSILVFYFYFIPSAIAISFKAKTSLWLIVPLSASLVIYNYFTSVTQATSYDAHLYKIFYSIIISN